MRLYLQPQDHKLTRLEDRDGLCVDRDQNEGGHAIAFLTDMCDSHLSESGPCRSLFFICKTGIPLYRLRIRLLQDRLERSLPACAQGWDTERSFQFLARMSRQIQESVDVGNGHSFWTVGNFYDVIARPNLSFLQHAKIKPWPSVRDKQGWHARLVHADADPIACYAWLGHFK